MRKGKIKVIYNIDALFGNKSGTFKSKEMYQFCKMSRFQNTKNGELIGKPNEGDLVAHEKQ